MDLDGLPVAKGVLIAQVPTENEILYIDVEYSLFDYPHCRRIIKATTILSTDIATISQKITKINDLEELFIKMDYVSPLLSNNKLAHKRILPAIGWLRLRHPNIKFVIMDTASS